MQRCEICSKTFANRQNLNRHRKKVHGIKKTEPELFCSLCNHTSKTLLDMQIHLSSTHGGNPARVCTYCKQVFITEESFTCHLQNEHSLPVSKQNDSKDQSPIISAFEDTFKTFRIDGENDLDFLEFMLKKESQIRQKLFELAQKRPLKVQISVNIRLEKPTGETSEKTDIHLNTDMTPVFAEGLSKQDYFEMIDKLLSTLFSFTAHGSGWLLDKIKHLDVKMVSFTPVRGSSYIALPSELQGIRSLLNIRNHLDNKCFLYCFTAAYHLYYGPPLETDTWRTVTSPPLYSSNNPAAHQPLGNFDMPMGFKDMVAFEDLNQVQVNVFKYEKKQLFPLRLSKKSEFEFVVDLLLLQENSVYHYVLIKNLLNVVNHVKQRRPQSDDVICRNCFHICSASKYTTHYASCMKFEAATIEMPSVDKNKVVFQNFNARAHAPVVVYFDLESLIIPTTPNELLSTKTIEKHEPCGFCFVIVEHGLVEPVHVEIDRSESCMKKLTTHLQSVAREVYKRKQSHRVFRGSAPYQSDEATQCWICLSPFGCETIVLDHCHYSGKFLGYAHSQCNLKRRSINYTPVIAHNSSNYDLHHLCKNLHEFDADCKIEIVPLTDEKYLALSVGVVVNRFVDKRGVTKNVYEYLRFIDSFRFLPSSLDKLVSYLPAESFDLLDNYFDNFQHEEKKLLHQKGFYPYNYFDNFAKFNEKDLPSIEFWKNSLNGGEISITETNYAHAERVFVTFGCKTLGDYHDLYLKCDTLLLACVVEEFRKVCYDTYGLDSVHYFTSSHLSGDAFLKTCEADLELLTDREHLEMAENMIRGGVASIFSKRLFQANNKYLKEFNATEESSYGFLVDANNLYGGVMEKLPLPLKNFRKVNVPLEQILSTDADSSIGYILEVDLEYPDDIHDSQKDFPLAPTKENIEENSLSEFQLNLLQTMGIKKVKTPKLVQTLNNKNNYTIHYLNLKLYVELGMVVRKVHRILQFTQALWLKPYIEKNTTKRQQATNKFEESFFKLMNNSCYGKTLESKRNRVQVQLIRTPEEARNAADKTLLKTFKIFDENLAAVTFKKPKIYWNKPTIVGACILELSKFHMFNFHYRVMKQHLNCELLYSDTDSLLYEIKHQDLYKELAENLDLKKHFDFSNYPVNHPLFDESNKMVTLLFKDELAGKLMEEFVGLKPKMYSIKYNDGKQKMSAKGVSRYAQNCLKHDVYKHVISTSAIVRTNNVRIGSNNHQLETISNNKVSLSAFDDKRYIQENGINTLPFGHYLVRDISTFREILADPDWGEEEVLSSPGWDTLLREYGPSQFDDRSNRTLPQPMTPVRQRERHYDTLSQILDDSWSPPDPGLHQDDYTESELDEETLTILEEVMGEHVHDFYNTYGQEISETARNPFIDDEAEEVEEFSSASEECEEPPRKKHVIVISSDEEFL